MIQEVDEKNLFYIQNILKREFDVSYTKDAFSKEFVYIVEKEIVGLIAYSLIYDRIELNYIYVDKDKRNMGIASRLLQQMILDGTKNNIRNITLEVNVNNLEAISLYNKYDFVIVTKRKGYYNGEDGYLMIRE